MAGAVHLSLGNVPALAQEAQREGLRWLSAGEQARLARISAATRRDQFIAGRWLSRRLLAATYGGEPTDWSLSAPDSGPPAAQGPLAPAPCLSLSHSAERVACAVGRSPLGLDLEVAGRARDFDGIAAAVCSVDELARLRNAEPSAREAMFYQCWTLKEAWLKSRGEDASPGRMAQIHTSPAPATSVANARLWAGPGLTLALVVDAMLPVRWTGQALEPLGWCAVSDAAAQSPSGVA